MAKKEYKYSSQEIRFIKFIAANTFKSATEAAIQSGYSKKSAHVTASRLLRKDKIQKKLAEEQDEALKELDISKLSILKEYAKIAFQNIADFVEIGDDGKVRVKNVDELTKDQQSCIQTINSSLVHHNGTVIGADVKMVLHDKKGL